MHLPVKKIPGARHRGHGTLTLRNVLHVPFALCNIVGTPVFQDYKVSLEPGPVSDGSISLSDGTPVGYFVPGGQFCEARLSGPPVGPCVGSSQFKPDARYWINAGWSETEREKWLRAPAASAPGDAPQTPAHPSEEEKRWLKRHFDGEFNFLRCYGLSIYKDEEREECWQIMRPVMSQERADVFIERLEYMSISRRVTSSENLWLEDHHSDLETFMEEQGLDPADQMDVVEAISRISAKVNGLDSSSSSDFEWDNGAPEKLLCNSYFERDELKWVKARHGDAVSFMLSMGLKFNDPGDGEKAS